MKEIECYGVWAIIISCLAGAERKLSTYYCYVWKLLLENNAWFFEFQVSHCEDTIHNLKQKLSDKQKEVREGFTQKLLNVLALEEKYMHK